MKFKIKRGDTVVVIAGSHKGERGKVLEVNRQKQRVTVEGVAVRKIHQKPRSQEDPGGIIEREGSVHYSNVMLAERFDSKQSD
jgi:large subunit ribosomal protein L24